MSEFTPGAPNRGLCRRPCAARRCDKRGGYRARRRLYFLLHRHDFGMDDAPAGACILYALSCGLSDRELAGQYDLLLRTGGKDVPEEDEESKEAESEEAADEGSGSKMKLKPWHQRKGRSLGYEGIGGRPPPLIDQVHRLMHLWKLGEVVKVNEYLDARALRQNKIFHQLLQALIELAALGSEERSLLEKISNHVVARGVAPQRSRSCEIFEHGYLYGCRSHGLLSR